MNQKSSVLLGLGITLGFVLEPIFTISKSEGERILIAININPVIANGFSSYITLLLAIYYLKRIFKQIVSKVDQGYRAQIKFLVIIGLLFLISNFGWNAIFKYDKVFGGNQIYQNSSISIIVFFDIMPLLLLYGYVFLLVFQFIKNCNKS